MDVRRSLADAAVAIWFGVGPTSVAIALLLVGIGGLGGTALHLVRMRRAARGARPRKAWETLDAMEPGRHLPPESRPRRVPPPAQPSGHFDRRLGRNSRGLRGYSCPNSDHRRPGRT